VRLERYERYKRYMPGSYVEEMHPATRQRLVRYFRPYNLRLCELVGVTYPWDQ